MTYRSKAEREETARRRRVASATTEKGQPGSPSRSSRRSGEARRSSAALRKIEGSAPAMRRSRSARELLQHAVETRPGEMHVVEHVLVELAHALGSLRIPITEAARRSTHAVGEEDADGAVKARGEREVGRELLAQLLVGNAKQRRRGGDLDRNGRRRGIDEGHLADDLAGFQPRERGARGALHDKLAVDQDVELIDARAQGDQ